MKNHKFNKMIRPVFFTEQTLLEGYKLQSRTHLPGVGGDGYSTVTVVLDGTPALVYQGSVPGRSEKGGNSRTPRSDPLGQCSLGSQRKLD